MNRIRRVLQVRPGEGAVVLRLFLIFMLLSVGSTLGVSATDALLYVRFGTASLPALYVALGVIILTVTLVMTALLARGARGHLYAALLVALGVTVILARLAYATRLPAAYPVVSLSVNAVSSVQGLIGWGLAGLVCDARQAKRLFPLFAAGGVLGSVLAGFLSPLLVALLHSENMLLLWGAALLAGFLLTRSLPTVAAPPRVGAARLWADLREGFDTARASAMLRWFAVAIMLFSVLYFSLAFPFAQAATHRFANPDALTGFLGVFSAAATGTACLASLLLAGRFYLRFGLMNGILVFAAIYVVGFASLLLLPSFGVLVGFRFLQLAWMFGVAGTAYHAVFNVVPDDRRDQARVFIDGVGTQVGTIVGGLVLLLGQRTLQAWEMYAIGLVAGVIAVVSLQRAGRLYGPALVAALRSGNPHVFAPDPHGFVPMAADPRAMEAVSAAARDSNPALRAIAAETLPDLAGPAAADDLRRLAEDGDPAVRCAALAGLASLGGADGAPALELLRELAESADPAVRRRAVAALGAAGDARAVRLALADHSASVREAAAVAAASMPASDGLMQPLLGLLGDRDRAVREAAAAAVAGAGEAAAAALLEALSDPAREAGALTALPHLRSGLPHDGLVELAAARQQAALEALAMARAARAGALPAAGLLADSLLLRARRQGVAVLQIRSALGEADYSHSVAGLESSHSSLRATALEALEALAPTAATRALLPLWEDSAEPFAFDPHQLEPLRVDNDPWIRECAALVLDQSDGMKTHDTLPVIERVLLLKQATPFAGLDPADLKRIAEVASEHVFRDGHTIVRQGDPGGEMFIVLEGAIRVVGNGSEIARRGRGDAVGEMALLTGEPRMASLIAEGDVRVLALDAAHFESIVRERPEVGMGVIRTLSERLRERV